MTLYQNFTRYYWHCHSVASTWRKKFSATIDESGSGFVVVEIKIAWAWAWAWSLIFLKKLLSCHFFDESLIFVSNFTKVYDSSHTLDSNYPSSTTQRCVTESSQLCKTCEQELTYQRLFSTNDSWNNQKLSNICTVFQQWSVHRLNVTMPLADAGHIILDLDSCYFWPGCRSHHSWPGCRSFLTGMPVTSFKEYVNHETWWNFVIHRGIAEAFGSGHASNGLSWDHGHFPSELRYPFF